MRAKPFIFAALVVVASAGCANAQRFLPGGIIKVRDLEKGRPINQDVVEDITSSERSARKASFPLLREQPATPPTAKAASVVRAETSDLMTEKARLERAIGADREAAIAERRADD
ncbi:MAG: hypothetical protein GC152_06970 [Alphaproteobacteria bacterium]|nr:hypothetical protein [Alphaproteobacteria bacterium]